MSVTSNRDIQPRQHIFQVSELNKNIKRLLEESFPFLWISGEISNFKIPPSGHVYFTLKDAASQISAVVFRGQAAGLKFKLENGLSVIGLGRLGVYEPRGTYQIIFEYLEPKGVGALQLAFEQLKRKLADEGLFDDRHKSPLPALPRMVSVVTSPTGAVVRDFIRIARRRYDNLHIQVVPVTVQGARAPVEMVQAIDALNRIGQTDVIVLARGGGSIEDLWAFNDEALARAVAGSKIPVVSAIGHETDFTIADFVADLRAPTPSAAAELVVPQKEVLQRQVRELQRILYRLITNKIELKRKNISTLGDRIVHPKRRLQDLRMRLDDDTLRLGGSIQERIRRDRERLAFRHDMVMHLSPARTIDALRGQLTGIYRQMVIHITRILQQRQDQADQQSGLLATLNPLAILERGYSITRTRPEGRIVRRADGVETGQSLEIILSHGRLQVTVNQKDNP